mmetsp:Transcript_77977/g.172814  ORF Transcript_77977/g.172814 Transcript_77977/m.172814 type:complete len:377 (-) Transcript_77977:99-1229(-)
MAGKFAVVPLDEEAPPHHRAALGHLEDEAEVPFEQLDEDMFGMTVCALVRDFYFLEKRPESGTARFARLGLTLGLLFICVTLQVALLGKIKRYVSASAVHDIRIAYDAYEMHMYNVTFLSENGKHRGVEGTFNEDAFDTLSFHMQTAVCQIPMSQPNFFFLILCIWSLTCLAEIKKSVDLFQSLILQPEHCESMVDSMCWSNEYESGDLIVARLTRRLKMLIMMLVIIPRLCITGYLLWVGCRWLLATNNFSDLILNAVALEFILVLKELIYRSLMTLRNKLDLGRTKVLPRYPKEQATVQAFTRTIVYGLLAVLWVVIYMGIPHVFNGFQTVLPDYKWDVNEACESWRDWRYCVDEPCPTSPIGHFQRLAGNRGT